MILVLGSFIVDLVATTARFPLEGESVRGNTFNIYPGGKGANQAVQIKRLGGDVILSGAIGKDMFGDLIQKTLKKEKLNLKHIIRTSQNGVSNVTINEKGQNNIVMVPGANLEYSSKNLQSILPLIDSAKICLTQLEMSLDVISEFINIAKSKGKIVILNPAPAAVLSDELLNGLDYITPNETELEFLTGVKISGVLSVKVAAKTLLDKGVKNVIVTLGEKGCFYISKETSGFLPSQKVECVDSVGAGDAFNGGLAYALDKGLDIEKALKMALLCGTLSVTKHGAIPSLAYKNDLETFKNNLLEEKKL